VTAWYLERRPLFGVPRRRDNGFAGGANRSSTRFSGLSENVGRAVPVIEWILFLGLSALLMAFTLRRRHAYRFWRWVAFECALALVVMSAGAWFADPLSTRQVISWALLALSVVFAGGGVWRLRTAGAPSGDLEETTQLVTTGLYRYVRHPMYASLLLLGMGAYLKAPSWWGGIILVILGIAVTGTVRVEERDSLRKFGSAYADYMDATRRFIPFLI
jgi:protein-S-isoprenylcysteine O-methyltransferase Ste14